MPVRLRRICEQDNRGMSLHRLAHAHFKLYLVVLSHRPKAVKVFERANIYVVYCTMHRLQK
jgi:hypothetical protein